MNQGRKGRIWSSAQAVLGALLAGGLLVGCHRTSPSDAIHPGETRVTLAGSSFGITLPAGIALREDDPAVTGESTTHEELAEGFAAFQAPRRLTVADHATSWFVTAQRAAEMPATHDDAVRAALAVDPGQPQPRVLLAEDLGGGGFLVSTHAADRLTVHVWHPCGTRAWQCGGEDYRDPERVPAPSWLEDPAEVERARIALEAPCRSARALRE